MPHLLIEDHQWQGLLFLRRKRAELVMVLLAVCVVILSVSPVSGANEEARVSSTAAWPVSGGVAQPSGANSPLVYTGCGGDSAPLINGDYEQQVVELVNAARANQAPPLPPLKRVAALDSAGRYHAADMGGDDFFAHDTYDRVGPSAEGLARICAWYDRMSSYYDGGYKGENIAGGFATPQDAMNGWMNSPSHRANILSANYREIGVGYYEGSGTYFRYWVQDFGQRTDEYPLIVNGEAAETDSRSVQLYVYGSWEEMRLRNDDGDWAAWEPFQNTLEWSLDGGTGNHTVYVELRSGATVTSSRDSIYLTASASVLANVPESVGFIYSIPDGRFSPPFAQVTPLNMGDSAVLSWNVVGLGSWFTVSPSEGTTPSSFQIRPNSTSMNTPATYTGQLAVVAVGGVGIQGSPRPIDLTLRVIDTPIRSVYLPTVMQRASP